MRGRVTRHPQRARPPLTLILPTLVLTAPPRPSKPSQVQNVWKGKKSRENWMKMYSKAKLEAQDELFEFYYPGFQLPRSASFSRYCGGCNSLTIRSRVPLRFILFHFHFHFQIQIPMLAEWIACTSPLCTTMLTRRGNSFGKGDAEVEGSPQWGKKNPTQKPKPLTAAQSKHREKINKVKPSRARASANLMRRAHARAQRKEHVVRRIVRTPPCV